MCSKPSIVKCASTVPDAHLGRQAEHLEPVAAVGVEDALDTRRAAGGRRRRSPRPGAGGSPPCGAGPASAARTPDRSRARSASRPTPGTSCAAVAPARYARAVTCPRTSGTTQGRELRRTDG